MNYLPWVLLALATYSLVPPLINLATTGPVRMPSNVAAFFTNLILVVGTAVVVVYNREEALTYVSHPMFKYVALAGVFLLVGILAYYRALSLGPVSIVTPIFAMFLVVSSGISIVFLSESLTARKVVGIVLGVVAVYLVSVE